MSSHYRMGLGAVETLIERDRRVKREQRNRLLGIVSVFVAFGFFCALGGFLGGYRYGVDNERARQDAQPKKIVHVATPLTQWQCTKQEGREYLHACAARKRMEQVK